MSTACTPHVSTVDYASRTNNYVLQDIRILLLDKYGYRKSGEEIDPPRIVSITIFSRLCETQPSTCARSSLLFASKTQRRRSVRFWQRTVFRTGNPSESVFRCFPLDRLRHRGFPVAGSRSESGLKAWYSCMMRR